MQRQSDNQTIQGKIVGIVPFSKSRIVIRAALNSADPNGQQYLSLEQQDCAADVTTSKNTRRVQLPAACLDGFMHVLRYCREVLDAGHAYAFFNDLCDPRADRVLSNRDLDRQDESLGPDTYRAHVPPV